tara:strand:+ start:13684 stop:13986 length:303 start_codon:yes stop_codon:yes gene_type:complete
LIYFVDIDGTICSDTKGNYTQAQPLKDKIDKVNSLYDDGHTIIYWTARGMTRAKGNVHKAYELCYDLTRQQLSDWDVRFHELRMGKPYYDVFFEDKAEEI